MTVHVASGFALAGVFLGALTYWAGSSARNLLLDLDHAWALGAIFVLHAGLFACASFATAMCADAEPPGGCRKYRPHPGPALARRGEVRARRPSPVVEDGA